MTVASITSTLGPQGSALVAPPHGDAAFDQEVEEAAQRLVATALVQPVLASLRDGPFRSELFAPGPAEKRFGPLLDRHIADRITQAEGFDIVSKLREYMTPEAMHTEVFDVTA